MDNIIFLIEKYTEPRGVGFALSTAPFFQVPNNSDTDSVIIQQIRDANFSYVVNPREKVYMKIFALDKQKAMKYHGCSEERVFNQVIRQLIMNYPKQIMDFRDVYDIRLIKNITYQVGVSPSDHVVIFKEKVLDGSGGKIYLYNPSIRLQKSEIF